jgi:hypothetical protein
MEQKNETNLTPNSFSPSSSWQYYQGSLFIPSNTYQASPSINWNPTGTAGASDYIDITGVQLEKGTIATPFEFRPYPIELQLCQRYYWQLNATEPYTLMGTSTGFVSSNIYSQIVSFPTTMRASPSLGVNGSLRIANYAQNIANIANSNFSLGPNSRSLNNTLLNVSGISSSFDNQGAYIQSVNNTTSYLSFSSEL